MITKLRLKNFKSWKDSGDIIFKPITVFFGANSSGKSSISQLLLLLKQTLESQDQGNVLHFGDGNSPVNLGTFSDIIYQGNIKNKLEFYLEWWNEEDIEIIKKNGKTEELELDSLGLGVTIGQKNNQNVVLQLKESFLKKAKEIAHISTERNYVGRYDFPDIDPDMARGPGKPSELPNLIKFFQFPPVIKSYFKDTSLFDEYSVSLSNLLSQLYYLGPLREYPKQIYRWSGSTPAHVSYKGESSIDALLSANNFGKQIVSPKYYRTSKPFEEVVSFWLKEMGLIYEFHTKPIRKNGQEYEVLVKVNERGRDVRLTDVGIGISQVIPVIIQTFYAPINSCIIFEQPEIHLHPKAQVGLADLFIDGINSKEKIKGSNQDRDTQFIIETHSEHFLYRLQRRIAEGEVTNDQVALYFIKNESGESVCEALSLDEDGNILNWPDNFFGDSLGEMKEMITAISKKKGKK